MMANKWVQAVLLGGFGLGMIVGTVVSEISGSPIIVIFIGYILMMACMWKTANCRGTNGWGGPYDGPRT